MEGDKGKVCVTGGTGFLASWLIMRLLEHGYSVHTTIRPDPEKKIEPSMASLLGKSEVLILHSVLALQIKLATFLCIFSPNKVHEHKRDVSFLTSLPEASEKLQIFQADLSDPDSFEVAIKGCIGVFHVATPLDFERKEPEEVVVQRAIDGTLGILKACLNSITVKRVVYTSSSSAVVFNDSDVDTMDESYWTDVEYVKALKSFAGPYFISKTLTEKRALEFADEHGFDLVTIIPSFINGPFICSKFPGSVRTSLAMVLGEQQKYGTLSNTSMVHVDDVARAHIFLFEHPDAEGRNICSSHTITIEKMFEFLSSKYPECPVPSLESLKEIEGNRLAGLSSMKLLNLGFKFKYGLDEMFDGAIQSCKEKGYL